MPEQIIWKKIKVKKTKRINKGRDEENNFWRASILCLSNSILKPRLQYYFSFAEEKTKALN